MFSIAGMAEHPPASAAQPDIIRDTKVPESEANVKPESELESSSSPLLQELHNVANSTEAGTTTSKQQQQLQQHEAVTNMIPGPPERRAVTLSAPLATLLAAQYANAVEHMLLGKLQGRNQPSARDLTTWCKKHLHSTFLTSTLLGLGYFEVAFSSPDGRNDTLRRSGFFLGDLEVVFSTWQPSFEPENPACVNAFPYAIWAQFWGLNSLLRTKECLTEIGKHIGAVLAVEEDESYRAQVAGPRVRMLVSTEDLNALPARVEIPQIGRYGGKTCKVVYSGLPDRCDVCETYAHAPQNCPLRFEEEAEFDVDAENDHDSHSPEISGAGRGKAGGKSDDHNDGKAGESTTGAVKMPMQLKPLRLQRQTSVRSEDRVVFQHASSFVENLLKEEDYPRNPLYRGDAWAEHGKSHSNQALTGSVNSQYAMSLSGPLSAPHSPPAHENVSSRGATSRWASSSCAGISAIATKFSSRPAHVTT